MSTVAQCKMAAGVRGKEREGVRERETERDVENGSGSERRRTRA